MINYTPEQRIQLLQQAREELQRAANRIDLATGGSAIYLTDHLRVIAGGAWKRPELTTIQTLIERAQNEADTQAELEAQAEECPDRLGFCDDLECVPIGSGRSYLRRKGLGLPELEAEGPGPFDLCDDPEYSTCDLDFGEEPIRL